MSKISHYKYLDKHLPAFFEAVGLNMDAGYAGIVSAHGDKAYGYRAQWERAGIPFPHGVALYMLSYTPLMSDEDRYRVADWVVDNYPAYKPLLPPIDETDPEIQSLL